MSEHRHGDDLGRISRRPYHSSGLDRQQRLTITLGVTAAIILSLGIGIGFALGRASAPKVPAKAVTQSVVQTETTMPAGVFEEIPTDTVEPDLAAEDLTVSEQTTVTDDVSPSKPKQTSPSDGAVINSSRVYLRWSKSTDDSGDPVTYSFEIQDRASNGSYGKTQVISKLKSTSYSARVLYVRRRWRVWAVDASGNQSAKSGWHYYIHKAKPASVVTPPASDETT